MGAIFSATHARLSGKQFAIKVLAPEVAENPELLQRFRREAEIASQLGHEHIVDVVDFNVADGMAYMVMELLDGEDLGQRIRARGPMPLDAVERIAGEVCSALDAAHRANIVHRDLKPPNIFLCRRGGRDDFVKVLDFGVSKVLDSSSIVTRDHALVGTPYYMSPEQADGRVAEIDARTDVFALGAIIWEMLIGRMAFEAPSLSVALYKVAFVDPPEAHLLRPDVPPAVSAVLRHAMAKDRVHRTATATQLARELGEALRGAMPASLPPPAPGGTDSLAIGLARTEAAPPALRPPSAVQRRGTPFAVGALVGGLALAGVGWMLWPRGTPPVADVTPMPPPAPAPAPPDAAPAPLPAKVMLRFSIEPANVGARLDMEGYPLSDEILLLPRGDQPILFNVTARGYVTAHERVVPDRDKTVSFVLQRKPSPPRTAPAKTTQPTPPRPTAPSPPPAPAGESFVPVKPR